MDGTIAFVHRFLTSLFFTDIIEILALVALLRFVFRRPQITLTHAVTAGLFASFMTIPYVWFVFPYLTHWPSGLYPLIAAETFAFIVEALFYRAFLKVGWGTAFALSLICNVVSYFLGPFLRTHGLWLYW